MFKNLRGFIDGEATLAVDKDGMPTERDLMIGVVMLLLELSHGDSHLAPEEVTELVRNMNREFALQDHEIADLMEVAEVLRKNRGKVEHFIETVNSHYDDEQRQVILAMLWRLIRADGRIEKSEQQLAIKLRTVLNLSLEQAVRAVQMSEEPSPKR